MRMNDINIKKFFDNKIIIFYNKKFSDHRGFFFNLFNEKIFGKYLNKIKFVQDNISFSKKINTIRGLHFQIPPHNQAKLIFVLEGEILDVVVDINPNSKYFGKSKMFKLDSKKNNSLFVSDDFAHGFCTLKKNTKVLYKVSKYYNPKSERTIIWNDRSLLINWPYKKKPFLSEKDKVAQDFNSLYKTFNLFKK